MSKVDFNKHIWEGWTVGMFIEELELTFNMIMGGQSCQKPFKTKEEVKKWCMDNQPYYKKHIPDVVNYFFAKIWFVWKIITIFERTNKKKDYVFYRIYSSWSLLIKRFAMTHLICFALIQVIVALELILNPTLTWNFKRSFFTGLALYLMLVALSNIFKF